MIVSYTEVVKTHHNFICIVYQSIHFQQISFCHSKVHSLWDIFRLNIITEEAHVNL